jgi:hypothetical protein
MVVTTELDQLVTGYRRVADGLADLLTRYPGAYAVRNTVGNIAILDRHHDFIAAIDVLQGALEEYTGDDEEQDDA